MVQACLVLVVKTKEFYGNDQWQQDHARSWRTG